MQRKKGSKRIEIIIKMVNEFKLTVVHFARPNRMQIRQAAGPSRAVGRWAFEPPGLKAAGPSGRPAAGPSPAVGRGPAFSKPLILLELLIEKPFDAHTDPLLRDLKFNKVCRYLFFAPTIGKLTYSYNNNLLPPSFCIFFKSTNHIYRLVVLTDSISHFAVLI